MTTVAEFIEYLKTIPEDTIIQVVVVEDQGWDRVPRYKNLDITDFDGNISLLDLKGNPRISKSAPSYNKTYLEIGET